MTKVYEAIATPQGVAGWWTTDTTGGSKPGDIVVTKFYADGNLLGGFDLKIVDVRISNWH